MVGPTTGLQVAIVGKVLSYLHRSDTPGLTRTKELGWSAVPAVKSHGYPWNVEYPLDLVTSQVVVRCRPVPTIRVPRALVRHPVGGLTIPGMATSTSPSLGQHLVERGRSLSLRAHLHILPDRQALTHQVKPDQARGIGTLSATGQDAGCVRKAATMWSEIVSARLPSSSSFFGG